jgi:hypothetical protein
MYMNAESGNPNQRILAIYWGVAPAAIRGMLDQIRTSLTQLVAEIRATMASDEDLPSPQATDQAVSVVVTGKRSKVSVTTAQAAGPGSTATTNSTHPAQPPESGWWARYRKPGAFLVGAAAIVGAVAAVIALL